MLIARQKRQENIIGYLIYMFQVEDMIRACNMDIDTIENNIISRYHSDYGTMREIREWYKALVSMMIQSNTTEKGHIPLLETLIGELEEIHQATLGDPQKADYFGIWSEARSALEELKFKSGKSDVSDIRAGLNGLYTFLLLKISEKKINPETEVAMNQITAFLSRLGERFHRIEKGEGEP